MPRAEEQKLGKKVRTAPAEKYALGNNYLYIIAPSIISPIGAQPTSQRTNLGATSDLYPNSA